MPTEPIEKDVEPSEKLSKPAPTARLSLAYRNDRFLKSPEARSLRIMAEYLEPQTRLRHYGVQHTVVFFGSARILPQDVALERLRKLEAQAKRRRSEAVTAELKTARMAVEMSRYYEEARELAGLITQWSLSLHNGANFLVVCSGGGPGIMEAANRGAMEAGGKSIGLNIQLPREQKPNPYISPGLSFLFRYFFMRKLWFAEPAKALIAFPGGFGTMDELWEFLTLMQTHKISQGITLLLYGSKFWKKAIDFTWLVESGTMEEEELKLIRLADTPEQAFEILKRNLTCELALDASLHHPLAAPPAPAPRSRPKPRRPE